MNWLIVLLTLLPDLIELIGKIMEGIRGKPALQRAKYRKELAQVCRAQVKKVRGRGYVLRRPGVDVKDELERMLEKLA